MNGTGTISAIGGNSAGSNSSGGGGGRIAAYYDTDTFTGTISAFGGTGYRNGGAGTVFTKTSTNSLGDLMIDNNGNADGWTDLLEPIPDFNVVEIDHEGVLAPAPLSTTNMNALNIRATGYLRHRPNNDGGIYLNVSGNVLVEAGGYINADACGYEPQTGPGAGNSSNDSGSGGGYGGPGGNGSNTAGGGSYGSLTEPVDLGSGGGEETDAGGGAGRGGGAIRLSIGGTLTLDGTISANGGMANTTSTSWDHGGGSGGSIWIETDGITGAGAISADLDRDGDVDLSDLAQLLGHYGSTNALPEEGDTNGDGDVDLSDLAELLGNYGVGI